MPIEPDIYILHGGEESEKALADTIAAAFAGLPAKVVLMTPEDLVLRHKNPMVCIPEVVAAPHLLQGIVGRFRILREAAQVLQGTVIVLLSETMLCDADGRVALVGAIGGRSLLDFRRYFICRGTTPQELVTRYPDLASISENIMLLTEGELPTVIDDIKYRYTQRIPTFLESANPSRDGMVLICGTVLFRILLQVCRIHRFRMYLAAVLALLLCLRGNPTLTAMLIFVCFYVVGLGLNWVLPLDLWPWLGLRWKWSASLDSFRSMEFFPIGLISFGGALFGAVAAIITRQGSPFAIGLISGIFLQAVTDAVCFSSEWREFRRKRAAYPADLPVDETTCDSSQLELAIGENLYEKKSNTRVMFGRLIIVSLVAVVGSTYFPWPFAFAWLSAVALGVLTPPLIRTSWLAATRSAERIQGVTTMSLHRDSQTYLHIDHLIAARFAHGTVWASGIDDQYLVTFTSEEKQELKQFAFLLRSPAGLSLRRWFRERDYAFISYVWKDEEKRSTAEHLDRILQGIGIQSFRDKRAIQDPFSVWREHIALALMRCTHFFLVVSPGIKNGQVVLREIETVLGRWYTEMLPAVICIVNPEDARELRNDPQVPLHVRFLLTCCPQMTIAEAEDPRRVRYILEHTRRQGKWSDWLSTLSPLTTWNRIQRMPGIVRPIESRPTSDSYPKQGADSVGGRLP